MPEFSSTRNPKRGVDGCFQSETSVFNPSGCDIRRCDIRRVFSRTGCLFSHAWCNLFSISGPEWLIASRGLDRLDVTCHFLDTLCLELNLSH